MNGDGFGNELRSKQKTFSTNNYRKQQKGYNDVD